MLKVITAVLPGGEKLRATTRIDGKTRQRTIPFDPQRSWNYMHGAAAGTLMHALNISAVKVSKHENLSNHYHIFWIEV